jgi:hypothetical protein
MPTTSAFFDLDFDFIFDFIFDMEEDFDLLEY